MAKFKPRFQEGDLVRVVDEGWNSHGGWCGIVVGCLPADRYLLSFRSLENGEEDRQAYHSDHLDIDPLWHQLKQLDGLLDESLRKSSERDRVRALDRLINGT